MQVARETIARCSGDSGQLLLLLPLHWVFAPFLILGIFRKRIFRKRIYLMSQTRIASAESASVTKGVFDQRPCDGQEHDTHDDTGDAFRLTSDSGTPLSINDIACRFSKIAWVPPYLPSSLATHVIDALALVDITASDWEIFFHVHEQSMQVRLCALVVLCRELTVAASKARKTGTC